MNFLSLKNLFTRNPFKFIFCALSFLPGLSNAENLIGNKNLCTKPFLDVEQRPGANALFPSSIEHTFHETHSNEWHITGSLGVIKSDERLGEYVGFSGVEIKRNCFSENVFSENELNLNLKKISSNIKVITVQIKTKQGLFAHDLKITNENIYSLISEDFRRSFRGKISEEVYTKDFAEASALRVFLKRSTNAPTDSNPLFYEIIFKIK